MPTRVLDFWEAFDYVEPIGEAWRQTAETNVLLERQIELEAMKIGAKFDPGTVERHMPLRFKPNEKIVKHVKRTKKTKQTEFDQVAATLGLSEIVKKHGRNNKSS